MGKKRTEMKTWWFNFPLHVDDTAHLIDSLPGRQIHTHTHIQSHCTQCPILLCISHTIATSTSNKNIYSELQWFVTFFVTRRCWLAGWLAAGILFSLSASPVCECVLTYLFFFRFPLGFRFDENTTRNTLFIIRARNATKVPTDTHSTSLHGCWTGLICITSHFFINWREIRKMEHKEATDCGDNTIIY